MPLIPSVPNIFFHFFNKVSYTNMLCLVSLTLYSKNFNPCDKAKLIDDIVPPILSLVSYFPEFD